MRHNADKISEDIYYFYHKDPQFIIQFDKEISISKILINFNVEAFNIDAYQLYMEKVNYFEEIIKGFYERKIGQRMKDVFMPPKEKNKKLI